MSCIFLICLATNRMEKYIIQYENIEIEKVCRICLTEKDNMNMISETGLAEVLLECTSIQVKIYGYG